MPKPVKARPATSWTYVLACDQDLPAPDQTRFVLRPMTGVERDIFLDGLAQFSERSGEAMRSSNLQLLTRRIAVSHIVSVENFPPGAPRSWPKEPEERFAYLEQLEDAHVREIGLEIWRTSALTKEERDRAGESLPLSGTFDSGATKAAETSTIAPSANAIPA